jgi:hypothetical protein
MLTLPQKVRADVIYQCGQGGEQTAEMYASRYQAVLAGQHSTCKAISGSGQCTCSSSTDCNGGTCTGTLCTTGSRASCVEAGDCATGFVCAFAPPDYLATMLGFNDINPFGAGDRQPDLGGWQDPDCTGANTVLGPAIGCPLYGTGQFQAPKTYCVKDSDCAAVSPYATCNGWCNGGADPDKPCRTTAGVLSGADCDVQCTTNSTACVDATTCANVFTVGGPTCSPIDPLTPIVRRGLCRCTTDAQCASGYACVGDTGSAVCRLSCTSNLDCNSGRGLTCITATATIGNGKKVCSGVCRLPCDAITCTKDADCAPAGGNKLSQRYAQMIAPSWIGQCNLARGRCANCGPSPLGGQQVRAKCTCTAGSECGAGGTCTNNLCAAAPSDAKKVNCYYDADCATSRQCMRAATQQAGFRAHATNHLALRVAGLMYDTAQRLYGASAPRLLFMAPPSPGGQVTVQGVGAAGMVPDEQGTWTAGLQLFYDRDYYDSIRQDYLATCAQVGPLGWLPCRYVIDPEPLWKAGKMTNPYHTDQVHLATVGGTLISNVFVANLERLNVCLKADAVTPQKYCMHASEVFATSGGTDGTGACTADTDCASVDLCVRRPCNGNAANCPNATDTCGPD